MITRNIEFGDITSVTSGLIIHGCNAQGVMGSGIAKTIRAKYPAAYESYFDHLYQCKSISANPLGTVDFYQPTGQLVIANAITQEHYGRSGEKYVSYRAIYNAFLLAGSYCVEHSLRLHYPTIGAGLGGGDWALISDIIDSALQTVGPIEHTLWIYE